MAVIGSGSTVGDVIGYFAPGLQQVVRHRYAVMSAAVHLCFFSVVLRESPRNLAFERIIWARRAELPRYDFLAADRQVISRLVRGEL